MLVLGNRHLAGLAVAGDLEEGGAGFQVEVVGEGCSVFAFQAGTELAAQAVAGVHQWGRGDGGGACFRGGRDAGRAAAPPAPDPGPPANASTPLMHPRYCLRRQLGACLKGKNATALPHDLYLKTGATLLKVTCNCKSCEMTITHPR